MIVVVMARVILNRSSVDVRGVGQMGELGVEAHIRNHAADLMKSAFNIDRDDIKWENAIVRLSDVLAVLAAHQPKTRIRVLNDTSKDLVIRRPPTSHKIQPQKMMLEFVEGNEVFLKVWDGNMILLSKDGVGEAEP